MNQFKNSYNPPAIPQAPTNILLVPSDTPTPVDISYIPNPILPAVSCNFRPALLPFYIQNLKNFPITFLFFPIQAVYAKKDKQTAFID